MANLNEIWDNEAKRFIRPADIDRPKVLPMGVLEAERQVSPESLSVTFCYLPLDAQKELMNQVDHYDLFRRLECN